MPAIASTSGKSYTIHMDRKRRRRPSAFFAILFATVIILLTEALLLASSVPSKKEFCNPKGLLENTQQCTDMYFEKEKLYIAAAVLAFIAAVIAFIAAAILGRETKEHQHAGTPPRTTRHTP